ncbi:MAG: C_GCAxxG_C_C family protein [Syntrophomonadaceae bacterium]|nr:C_GCAxxG_C_C family protein [Syntrophomonadaceae bacterium]
MEEILSRAFTIAKQYEMEYGGCPQCVIAGIFEALDIENNDVFKGATALADGVGLTGNGHCGALSGGTIAISYLFGRDREDFANTRKLVKASLLSKKLHDQFMEMYGTCRCADIQTKYLGRFFNLYDPAEMKAAAQAGMPEHCSTLVGEVARMTAKIILEEQARQASRAGR